ncbi:MAG: (2Fe-2S)-binding protein [Phycisphaerae bacterium]|nr:(2Fe-2S)-binding protein [Phycisphaerae bacterium]
MDVTMSLTVNGEKKTITTDPSRRLLDVLREDLQLTGTKYGCGQSQCGACTVLINGRAVHSCVTPVGSVNNTEVITVEGLARGDVLHPVQAAFLAEGAIQCGYCTPGMIMRAVALLDSDPNPSDSTIKAWMNANICRCNGYTKILNAVRRAARQNLEVTVP